MATTLYAPPGSDPRRGQLPTLHRVTRMSRPPTPPPTPVSMPARRHVDPDPWTTMGLPWQAYAAAVVAATAVMLVLAITWAGWDGRNVPAFAAAAVTWGASMSGLLDYVRAGARAVRRP